MRVKCRFKEFDVHTEEESKELGIKPISNWREAKAGDWILTHDGKVLEVYGRRSEKHASSIKEYVYIRTGYGEHGTHKNNIYAIKQKSSHDRRYSGKSLLRDVRPTALQKTFVDNLIRFGGIGANGMWDAESVIRAYQSTYQDNNPEQSLRRGVAILKRSKIKDYVTMNLREKLIESGLDDDWIIDQYKEIIHSNRPANVKLSAINRVSDMLGHDTGNKREEQTEEQVFALTDGTMKKLSAVRKKMVTNGKNTEMAITYRDPGDENDSIKKEST